MIDARGTLASAPRQFRRHDPTSTDCAPMALEWTPFLRIGPDSKSSDAPMNLPLRSWAMSPRYRRVPREPAVARTSQICAVQQKYVLHDSPEGEVVREARPTAVHARQPRYPQAGQRPSFWRRPSQSRCGNIWCAFTCEGFPL
jgi:hypothetical protein